MNVRDGEIERFLLREFLIRTPKQVMVDYHNYVPWGSPNEIMHALAALRVDQYIEGTMEGGFSVRKSFVTFRTLAITDCYGAIKLLKKEAVVPHVPLTSLRLMVERTLPFDPPLSYACMVAILDHLLVPVISQSKDHFELMWVNVQDAPIY